MYIDCNLFGWKKLLKHKYLFKTCHEGVCLKGKFCLSEEHFVSEPASNHYIKWICVAAYKEMCIQMVI